MLSDEFAPLAGVPLPLAPDLQLILAPNPSPMTYLGTNTYLLGHDQIAVIDPGPDDDAHLDAIMAAAGTRISHIIVTHAHLDHSPLAARLAAATGAPIYGFGPAHKGRSDVMTMLAADGLAGGGEGIDTAFQPDITLQSGDQITTSDWTVTALHTPGHIGNHICLIWGDSMFTGDHVMGWASSLVSPPDGDLTDFMASCAALQNVPARIYYPGHGAPVADPATRLAWLIAHRQSREAQILDCLATAPATASGIAQIIYHDVDPALLGAATRNVLAHLIDLTGRGLLTADPTLSQTANFRLKN